MVRKAAELGLDWEKVEELGEAELEEGIYGEVSRKLKAPLPGPASMDLELKKPGVTLQLLHVEYRESHPDGGTYVPCGSRCRRSRWRAALAFPRAAVARACTAFPAS